MPTEDATMSDISEMKHYGSTAAAGYDQGFADVSSYFIPFLVRAARIAAGQRVLDIATGTGLAAEVALTAIGPDGHLTAADVSPDMVEQAKRRFANVPNALVKVEDGQALSFPSDAFDTVLCSLGLMFFPDPARGPASFGGSFAPAVAQPCRSTRCQSDRTTREFTSRSRGMCRRTLLP
jgi:ubiquinone/menaquinone biosynthesis C-methylase UbiE